MSLDIGLDLGTANTLVYIDKAVALREPTAVAMDVVSGKPFAFGSEAYKMLGRTHDKIEIIRPVVRGSIADFDVVSQMLRYYLRRVCGEKMFKPRVMISVPSGITGVQKRSYFSCVTNAGARKVCLIESPIAAAIGAGVDVSRPHGAIVVDIGAGTTDVAVLSLGALSEYGTVEVAGHDIDDAIIRYIRREYNILIGEATAERIKMQIGGVVRRPIEVAITAKGRNLFTGLPQIFEVSASELYDVIMEPVDQMIAGVQSVMERTSPELMADILSDGIILTGNGAKIYGMEELMRERLGTKANLVSEPDTCVARGTGIALKNMNMLQKNGEYKFTTLDDLVIDY